MGKIKETEKFLVIYDVDCDYDSPFCDQDCVSDFFDTYEEATDWIVAKKTDRMARKELEMHLYGLPYNFKIAKVIWSEGDEMSLGQKLELEVMILTQKKIEELKEKRKKDPFSSLYGKVSGRR